MFIMPALLTKSYTIAYNNDVKNEIEVSNNIIEKKDENVEQYNYKEYNKIKLLHKKDKKIEEIPLDEYLLGVVSAEMPANFEQEALNAQALVARTYTIYSIKRNKNKHEGADICDSSTCCQAWISKEDRLARWNEDVREEYWNKIVKAVNTTKGKVITYNGDVIDAFFHSNSGGITEIPVNVWGGTNFPYLQSVQTSGEEGYSQYSSEVTLTQEELINKIRAKHSDFNIDISQQDSVKILEYTEAGRVKNIQIGNLKLSGVEVRSLLGLKSTNFKIEINNGKVTFIVTGYGHGVGMSQTGADSMAKQGSNYEEIIKHFYTGVEITEF
ncbi:stage II sporulation protein D [Clostridium sp. CAG:793]|nr:stage II sporulation protein D [Clostridium sp. CAG:793]